MCMCVHRYLFLNNMNDKNKNNKNNNNNENNKNKHYSCGIFFFLRVGS